MLMVTVVTVENQDLHTQGTTMTCLEGAVKESEGVTIGKYRHPERFSRRKALPEPTLDGDDSDRHSIVTLPDWRWSVASWPHERWSRWRRYVGEFLASL